METSALLGIEVGQSSTVWPARGNEKKIENMYIALKSSLSIITRGLLMLRLNDMVRFNM